MCQSAAIAHWPRHPSSDVGSRCCDLVVHRDWLSHRIFRRRYSLKNKWPIFGLGTTHFGPKTLRHWFGGSDLSGHFGTSAEVSKRQFGPKCLTPLSEVFHPKDWSVVPYFGLSWLYHYFKRPTRIVVCIILMTHENHLHTFLHLVKTV